MAITIALLQGVNVGKYKRISMADFKQIISKLGGEDPVTVANSGNVVFSHDGRRSEEELRLQIEKAVSDHVGVAIPTVTRTDDEMKAVIDANPYPHVEDPKCLHVEFLLEPVPNALDDLNFGEDHLTMIDRDIYLHLPNKMSGTTYDSKTLFKRLGTHHTSRNWSTITKLNDLAEGMK